MDLRQLCSADFLFLSLPKVIFLRIVFSFVRKDFVIILNATAISFLIFSE